MSEIYIDDLEFHRFLRSRVHR